MRRSRAVRRTNPVSTNTKILTGLSLIVAWIAYKLWSGGSSSSAPTINVLGGGGSGGGGGTTATGGAGGTSNVSTNVTVGGPSSQPYTGDAEDSDEDEEDYGDNGTLSGNYLP
jgi:hypothetical protein